MPWRNAKLTLQRLLVRHRHWNRRNWRSTNDEAETGIRCRLFFWIKSSCFLMRTMQIVPSNANAPAAEVAGIVRDDSSTQLTMSSRNCHHQKCDTFHDRLIIENPLYKFHLVNSKFLVDNRWWQETISQVFNREQGIKKSAVKYLS